MDFLCIIGFNRFIFATPQDNYHYDHQPIEEYYYQIQPDNNDELSYSPAMPISQEYGPNSEINIDHRVGLGESASQEQDSSAVSLNQNEDQGEEIDSSSSAAAAVTNNNNNINDKDDQKPAETLLSMSIDPMSDGMTGDPDIKAVLANAEAQGLPEQLNLDKDEFEKYLKVLFTDEIPSSSSTNHRVPHQLNLAVGSSSNYENVSP